MARQKVINIKFGCNCRGGKLSPLNNYPFFVDGIKCYSLEGFIVSLLSTNVEQQDKLCRLSGVRARIACGRGLFGNKSPKIMWVHWQGKKISRFEKQYQQLLDVAIQSWVLNNIKLQSALQATKGYTLKYNAAGNDPTTTLLTENELCDRLMAFRDQGVINE